ncbi:Nuclear pore complex protein NUP107 [Coccomyxa sp. Obi]|nr:Nuclear pore complex protein NUP107 [Coccomyxa sp. Obi]
MALPPPPAEFLSMNVQPIGAQGASAEVSEEGAFADVVAELMQEQFDSTVAVQRFANICQDNAAALREQAVQQQNRAARALRLQEQAAALEAEAATWQLLWHLHGARDAAFPAGSGGQPAPGGGRELTVAQRAAAILCEKEKLNWVARVVAWLEALAGEALDRSEEAAVRGGGSGARFARGEGVPRETRQRLEHRPAPGLGRAAADAVVTELDPDAPTRQGRRWVESNVKDEERLTRHLFRLLRCGRTEAARQLCHEVGQPWRSASLGCGGGLGLIPLGAAAEMAEARSVEECNEELASEIELGSGTLRALWRWACYQASERIGQQSSGQMEAAVYGALAGNVERILPACASWQDATWALSRSWLEAEVDAALEVPAADEGISLEALISTAGNASADIDVLGEGVSVGHGKWPLDKLVKQLPRSFEDVFGAAARFVPAGSRPDAGDPSTQQRIVQMELIRGPQRRRHLLVDLLPSWVTPAVEEMAGDLGDELPQPARAEPKVAAGALRFAAHLGLVMSALGLVPAPYDTRASIRHRTLQDSVNALLQLYLMHLIDSGQHALIPLYACHLRADVRREVYGLFLSLLTASADMDACVRAFEEGSLWFGAWAEAGRGDMPPTEMVHIVEQAAEKSRWGIKGGPLLRAAAARWLWFSPATLGAAAAHTNQLLREFALGPAAGAAAAAAALLQLLPQEVRSALEQGTAEELEGYGDELAAPMLELRAWAAYFGADRLYRDWLELHRHLVTERPMPPSAEDRQLLRARGSAALQALLAAVTDQLLLYIAPESSPDLGPQTFTVFVTEQPGAEAAEEVVSGQEYLTLAPEDAAALAAELNRAFAAALAPAAGQETPELFGLRIEARSAAQQPLPGGEVGTPLQGVVQVDAHCGLPEGLPALTQLLADALKGALPGCHRPLQAVNLFGPDSAQAALCQSVCYPRLLLRCAELREALVALGEPGTTGEEVVRLVAGGGGNADALSRYFSPAELQQLLELERRAIVSAKANAVTS